MASVAAILKSSVSDSDDHKQPEPEWPKVIINNLSSDASLETVREFLENYGVVVSVKEEIIDDKKRVTAI